MYVGHLLILIKPFSVLFLCRQIATSETTKTIKKTQFFTIAALQFLLLILQLLFLQLSLLLLLIIVARHNIISIIIIVVVAVVAVVIVTIMKDIKRLSFCSYDTDK